METLQNFIGGRWEEAVGEDVVAVVNPATEEAFAQFRAGSADDVDRAVAAAGAAQPEWAALTVARRVELLHAWADTIAAHADELAELECREMGKPVGIGRTFVAGAVAGLKAAADQALTYPFSETVTGPASGSEAGSDPARERTDIVRHPLGVTAVITPWNFPVVMVLGALGPLLAAGNTVVVKPSERSPVSSARLVELAASSGLPAGVLNLVLGDSRTGAAVTEHQEVRLVHFTGSVGAGRAVGTATGRRLARSVLELGGKDAVVVDAGVDPVATAQAVAFGAFINTGQICTSMERVYVHEGIADEFIRALTTAARTFTIGDGLDPATVLGPLVDARQRDTVRRHVDDAVHKGATVRAGGAVPERPGYFYPATVLTGVDDTMLVMTEETFGPVAPVTVVSSFEEGLTRAAASRYGLAATVYTDDPDHIAAAARLPVGVVWVNQWQGGGPERLYEPARDSGMGATGARAAYDAATRPAAVHIAAADPAVAR
ncbi:aldehyde dehydrogenase family protein [Streptomyces kunmingensis]|uniref:Aldehyde dehydrogenase family protein n=1 Tax=Streptomyces kunmingensis TaxID=68225 RepID=A0ABU6CLT3_9ACTN|nr:aldehyde dehydrogenase family protein [Streptomyces kunmingensis]MEB3964835.1 aldehyde dehydrogenase family protein [Streptomyces kunmingensis]